MSRISQFLALVDDPRLPALRPDPSDGPLLAMLVHFAMEDGEIQEDEFALLQRVRSDLSPGELLAWAAEIAKERWDVQALAAYATGEADRKDLLYLAARMVAMDGDLHATESGRLGEIAKALGLDASAVVAAIDEVLSPGGSVEEATLRDALRHMRWDRLVPDREPLTSDLASAAPATATFVCGIRLEDHEVAGLYVEGLAARFDNGCSFVRWQDIQTYTRIPVFGAAFHLRTRDGQRTCSDPRLRDVGALVDCVYGRRPQAS